MPQMMRRRLRSLMLAAVLLATGVRLGLAGGLESAKSLADRFGSLTLPPSLSSFRHAASQARRIETSRPLPRTFFHFTTLSAWESIQRDGYLKPGGDVAGDDALFGVFAVEWGNFIRNWDKPRGPDISYVDGVTPFQDLLEYVESHGSAADSVVLLRLEIEPECDRLFVRDNRHGIVFGQPENFINSLKSACELKASEIRDGILEYIIADAVPVDRVSVVASVRVSDLPRPPVKKRRYYDPDGLLKRFSPSLNRPASAPPEAPAALKSVN